MALEAQNNPFTSILMVEAADVEALPDADPASGQRRLAVGPDHLLYLVSNSGVKTAVGGAGIANPLATDSLWDAAGDLVQGSGANTAAKLSAGSAGKVLTSNGAAAALTWETPSGGNATVNVNNVATNQTTTSTTYTDLSTTGPAVTMTVPASGNVRVVVSCAGFNGSAGIDLMSFALSSGNTLAAADGNSLCFTMPAGSFWAGSRAVVLTGLTPGSTVFTAKYRVSAGTGNFSDRQITVEALA